MAMSKVCVACDREFDENAEHCTYDRQPLFALSAHDRPTGEPLFDRYGVPEKISESSRSIIYKAVHLKTEKTVAIKLNKTHVLLSKAAMSRCMRSAKVTAFLDDERIVKLFDFSCTQYGQPFFVMEYVPWPSLRELLTTHGAVDPSRAVPLFVEIAKAIQHCHFKGVVHRNLRPEHVLVSADDSIKLLDFSLAALMPWSGHESSYVTATGEFVGEAIYASPEQCLGKRIEPTSDVYSAGVLFCEILTGYPPFRGHTAADICKQHVSFSVPPFSVLNPSVNVPAPLEELIVEKMLNKDPVRRLFSMEEFQREVQALDSGNLPVQAVSTPSLPSTKENAGCIDDNATTLMQKLKDFIRRFPGGGKN